MIKTFIAIVALMGFFTTNIAAAAETATVDEVFEEHQSYQEDSRQNQQRVEALDDETLTLVMRYNTELERYEDLVTYNDNLRELLASQKREQARLQRELQEIEVIRQDIVPLMVEMVDVLEQFVELDDPMLLEERQARVANLQGNLTRSDVDLAEKYRRLLEAYEIEAEYGQSLEAYEGSTTIDGETRLVDFLRVGRVALFYMSLDRSAAAIWDSRNRSWRDLPDASLDALDYAIRVARKQAPPNLLRLPLWTGAES